MADEATKVAVPSPAEPIEVEQLNDEQRESWIKDGTLPESKPEIKPQSDESAPSKPGEAEKPDAKSAESGTASKTKKEKPDQERNWRALESRAEKAEREVAELKAATKPAETKAAPSPADSTIKPPEKPKRPDITQFKTTAEFDLAMDKYDQEMGDFSAKNRAFEDAKAQHEKKQVEIQEFNKKVEERWKGMVTKSQELHDDFDTIALSPELASQIIAGSPIDEWVLQSDVGAEMLYFLGQNKEELKRIASLSRPAQHRELAKLEEKLLTPEEKPKPKLVTSALPPPKDIGGKGAAAEDEEKEALRKAADGDPTAYMELANKRDIAQRKKGR